MMMPGSAPFTPPSNDPVLSTVPSSLNSLVASPKSQTLPSRSWAYQPVQRVFDRLGVKADGVMDDHGLDAHDHLGVAGDLGRRLLQAIGRMSLVRHRLLNSRRQNDDRRPRFTR